MATQLAALSNEIAAAVAQAARNVVAVHARPRFSSSGVFWRPGVIVTAEHTIRREEEITVTLPDGTQRSGHARRAPTPAPTSRCSKFEAATRRRASTTGAPAPGTLALTIGRSRGFRPERDPRHHQRVQRRVAHLARRTPRPLPPARSHPVPRIGRRRGDQHRRARRSASPPARSRASPDWPFPP